MWIVFFTRSDWLLELRIASAIHLPALAWISRPSFCLISQKKELFGAGFWLVGVH